MGETAANLQNKQPFRTCQLGREGGFEHGESTPFTAHLRSHRGPRVFPALNLPLCICCLLKEGFYSSKREGIDAFFLTFSSGTCVVEAAAEVGHADPQPSWRGLCWPWWGIEPQ